MILYINDNSPKIVYLTEDKLPLITEHGDEFKPTYYSMDDTLELGDDPYARLDKKDQSGKKRNFAIKRNGEEYWVSRSSTVFLHVYCRDNNGEWCVLMSQRGRNQKHAGNWNVAGGYLDYGETLEQAAVRECYEECGVNVSGAKLINCGATSDNLYKSVRHRFACILDGVTNDYPPSMKNCEGFGTPEQEVQNVAWVPVNDLRGFRVERKQYFDIKSDYKRLLGKNTSPNIDKISKELYSLMVSNELEPDKYEKIMSILNS
jgi:ADP-ribose pyrophosphatase YjhB (NUDIX family)